MANKSTLKYYIEGKARIGYEFCYRNNANSMFLARARTNSLKLEEAKGRGNIHYNKNCKLCGLGEEDLVHFTIECPALEGKINYEIIDRSILEPRQRMIKLLYRQRNYQEVGNMIKNLWMRRKAILKFKKEEQIRMNNRINIVGISRSDPGPVGSSHTPIRWRSRGLSATRG